MRNNLILIGFMGCGKTSTSIKLSYRMRRTMIDTDRWIEQKQGKSISEIFAEEGEEAFRNMETQCLQELLEDRSGQIISVGGGLPMKKENQKLLRELGLVIYLQVTPQTVYERLKNDTTRPLLQSENPRQKIEELLEKRAPIYEQTANYIIEVKDRSCEEVAELIIQIAAENGIMIMED